MSSAALMAFLHHVAAFTLVGALSAEVALFKPPLTAIQARRIRSADLIFGLSAAALLAIGLLRVFYFEKGAGYYFQNGFFLAKLTLFAAASLVSIYPTMLFLSWRDALNDGAAPNVPSEKALRGRMCMMLELTAILGILLCAPFMARGSGLIR